MTDSLPLRKILWRVFGVLAVLLGVSVAYIIVWRTPSKVTPQSDIPVVDLPKELARLGQAEEAALTAYAWRDRSQGRVAIPLEKAKEVVLSRGFPTRPVGKKEAR